MSLLAPGLSPRLKGFPNRKPARLVPFHPGLVGPEWGWFHRNLIVGYPLWSNSLFVDDLGPFGGSHLLDSTDVSVSNTIFGSGVAIANEGTPPSAKLLQGSFAQPITIWALMRLDTSGSGFRTVLELHASENTTREFGVGYTNLNEVVGQVQRAGGQVNVVSTTTFSIGDIVSAVFISRSRTDHELYINGISEATSSTDTFTSSDWDTVRIHDGARGSTLIAGAVLSKALVIPEIIQLTHDPFGPFRTRSLPLFLPSAAIAAELTPSRYTVERFYLNS